MGNMADNLKDYPRLSPSRKMLVSDKEDETQVNTDTRDDQYGVVNTNEGENPGWRQNRNENPGWRQYDNAGEQGYPWASHTQREHVHPGGNPNAYGANNPYNQPRSFDQPGYGGQAGYGMNTGAYGNTQTGYGSFDSPNGAGGYGRVPGYSGQGGYNSASGIGTQGNDMSGAYGSSGYNQGAWNDNQYRNQGYNQDQYQGRNWNQNWDQNQGYGQNYGQNWGQGQGAWNQSSDQQVYYGRPTGQARPVGDNQNWSQSQRPNWDQGERTNQYWRQGQNQGQGWNQGQGQIYYGQTSGQGQNQSQRNVRDLVHYENVDPYLGTTNPGNSSVAQNQNQVAPETLVQGGNQGNNQNWNQTLSQNYNRVPGPHAGKGPKGYKRADERIQEDICERLAHNGQVDATNILVDVTNGEVTLQGTAPTRQMKRMAADIAEDVSGVVDVLNAVSIADTNDQMPGKTYTQGNSSPIGEMNEQTKVSHQS